MEKIKLGVIGCGLISNVKHLPVYKKLENVEISAYCDAVKENAENSNRVFSDGKAKVFTDYREMLKEDIDAVCICTPNAYHCQMTVDSLLSGKHVMCEKPMATSYRECLKMIDAKNKSGKLLTISYQNRFRRDSICLKKECRSGTLGDIYFGKAYALRRRGVPTRNDFLNKEKQGGGPLMDIGTHSLDLALFMMDNYQPLYVAGTAFRKLYKDKETANLWGDWDSEKFTVEDSAFGFVVMKNGATIILESSWALNSVNVKEAVIELCGTKAGAEMIYGGELRLNGVKNNEMYSAIYNFKQGGVAFSTEITYNESEEEAKTFINAILGKGKLYTLPEEASVVTRILEGIYISSQQKKPYYFD